MRPPHLFVHTDYKGPCTGIDSTDPNHAQLAIVERHPLKIASEVYYEVSASYAARAGLASPKPKVELLIISVDDELPVGRPPSPRVPVLYFYFENINWFESLVLHRGLRFSHFFMRKEGFAGGGARASVMNLLPFFSSAGCRQMLIDPEIQIDHGLIKRLWGRYSNHERRPFRLFERRRAADVIHDGMRHFWLHPVRDADIIQSGKFDNHGPLPSWADRAYQKITSTQS